MGGTAQGHRLIVRALGLVALALVAVGSGVLLALSGRETSGSATLRLPEPVRGDGAAERALRDDVARHASGCRTAPRKVTGQARYTVVDAIAAIACDARGIARARLAVYAFADAEKPVRAIEDLAGGRELRGPCTGGNGNIEWSTRAGRVRGSMLCFATPAPTLVWTDRARHTVSTLSSDAQTLESLLVWWQAAYRPQTAATRAEGAKLTRLVRRVIGGARCTPSREASPVATATRTCALPGRVYRRVRGLRIERLASQRLLRERTATSGVPLSHLEGSCSATVPAGRDTWTMDDRVLGTFYCAPSGNDEIYSWTLRSARLYMTFVYAGGDERGSYDVWSEYLSRIGR